MKGEAELEMLKIIVARLPEGKQKEEGEALIKSLTPKKKNG